MPRELVAIAPREPVIREYDDSPLGPTEIRIRTELASPKHGTELVGYRNDLVASRPYDFLHGVVMPRPAEEALKSFPMRLGNMAVGTVIDAGGDVTRFRAGDRVFGHFPIRETQTVDETRADPLPPGLTPEAAVCIDPVVMAMAVRDGGIKLGDRVAVFGLGAIGLIAIQLARLAGASQVIAVDPLENRRELAKAYGADVLLDASEREGDTGLEVRMRTGEIRSDHKREEKRLIGGYTERGTQTSDLGVDVAIETSGSVHALQQAIRAARFGGTVCVVSFYGRDAAGLLLGEEFHINRLQLISVRAESLPMRDAPAWNLERLVDLGIDWMASGRIRTEGILTPIVPFEESADAYRMIDEHPERSIKLGVRFGWAHQGGVAGIR